MAFNSSSLPFVKKGMNVFLRNFIWVTSVLLPVSGALAQSSVCLQIRAELASLSSQQGSGNPQLQGEANLARSQLSQVRLALQRNECDRAFLIFSTAPPVCSPLKAQAQQLEGRIRALDQAMNSGPVAQRRAQLLASLDRYQCNGNQQVQRPPGSISGGSQSQQNFLERLFGGQPSNQMPSSNAVVDPRNPNASSPFGDETEITTPALGGRMAVCVRTCDGYFFPINFEGVSKRDDYEQICKSLCPAAETRVFFKSSGGDIDRAAARDGSAYMSQPYALRYRESRDASCTCKNPNQTWAEATRGREDIVDARKGDIIVTPEKALALSRPKDVPAPDGKSKPAIASAQKTNPKQSDLEAKRKIAVEEADAALPESALPTGGSASSGIGPKMNSEAQVLSSGQGKTQNILTQDGNRRTVRVIAPNLAASEPPPAPKAGATPSTPAPSRAP